MNHYDFAVQQNGKTMRFVGAGDTGALFEKDGTKHSVTIVAPSAPGQMPVLTNEAGVELSLKKVAKPCSCRGGVWKTRMSELVAQL